MVERAPLIIKYASEQGDASFGWSVLGIDQINPHIVPIFNPGSETVIAERGEVFVDVIHSEILRYFNGPLSADLNIPPNYPYEFYEPGKDTPTYIGYLRIPDDSK